MDDDSAEGPVFEVWNHLWSSIDTAADEFRVLDPESRAAIEKVGALLVDARGMLAHKHRSREAVINQVSDELLSDPWIKHAAEIQVACAGISRADTALSRYFAIRPTAVSSSLPQRATGYVAEVIHTYAFGFDAACIALCRAALEQVIKDRLIATGEYTDARIRRERPTAGTLLANAKRLGVINKSADAAERLVKKGDTVMHNFIYDGKISETQARDSIAELIEVLSEVLGGTEDESAPAR